MNRRYLVAITAGLTVAATACHKSAPPKVAPTPTPPPSAPTAAPPPPATTPPPPPAAPRNNVDPNAAAVAATATMSDRIHFAYNIADISDSDHVRLDAKAALMKRYPALRVRVTGHADERGSDEYNIALGMRRATAAKDYLVRVGIDAGRIDVASLGRQVPIDTGTTEAAYAANRRDEFDIIAGTQSLRGN